MDESVMAKRVEKGSKNTPKRISTAVRGHDQEKRTEDEDALVRELGDIDHAQARANPVPMKLK